MLVLSRKTDESIWIYEDIEIRVLHVKGKRVQIGITAPEEAQVRRSEIPFPDRVEHLRPPTKSAFPLLEK